MALSAKDLLASSKLSANSLTEGGRSWGQAPMTEEQRRDRASAIARRTLVGSGNEDPTEDKPGMFRKVLGTMSAPGVGINALLYNATNKESTEDVDVLAEMGKSMAGEETITGSDTVREWGVENKWGQALGGFALDVLTDPTTYLTAGYGATVKAAAGVKSIDLAMDMRHLASLADDGQRANQLLKMSYTYGDDIAEIASKYAGKGVDALQRTDAQKVATALRQRLASEMGEKTGVRFAGITLPGMNTLPDTLTNAMKSAGEMMPGSQTWTRAFSSGQLDEIWKGASRAVDNKSAAKYGLELDALGLGPFKKGVRIPGSSGRMGPNELVRMGTKAARRKYATAEKAASAQGKFLRDTLVDLLPEDEVRHATTIGIGRQFGSLADQERVFEAYKNIGYLEDLVQKGDLESIPRLVEAQKKHYELMRDLTFDEGAILDTVRTALGNRYTDDVGQRVTTAVQVVKQRLDEASYELLGLGKIKTAAGQSVMDGAYLPGMVGDSPTAGLSKMFDRLGMDVAPDLRLPSEVDRIPQGFDSGMSKTYLNPEARLKEGLLTNTDFADNSSVKVMQDEMKIAKAEFADEMSALYGRSVDDKVLNETISKLSDVFTNDVTFKGALETYDKVLNEWKSMATALNIPRFQARNFLSNKYLMMVQNNLDLASEKESIRFLTRVRDVLQKGEPITSLGKKDQQFFMELVDNGIFTSKEDLMGLVGTKRLPEYAIGMKDKSDNLAKRGYDAWKKLGGDLNELVENQGRLSVYLYQKSKGVDPRVAAQVVDDTLYSYDAQLLTAFENNVMKRVLPFYTWMRRNTPNMAQMLATNPKMASIPAHLQQNTQDTVGYDQTKAPEYLREAGLIFGMGSDDPTDQMAIRTDALMPLNDVGMFIDSTLGLDPLKGLGELGEDVNPMLRVPLELLFNKSLYTENDISGGVMGKSRKVSKGLQLLDDIGRTVPGWTDLMLVLGGRYEENDDGRVLLTLPGKVAYTLSSLFPPLESAGGMNPENADYREQIIGFLTGVRPVNIDIPALEDKKKTNDYFALQEAMADKRRVDRKRIDLPTLFGGGQ